MPAEVLEREEVRIPETSTSGGGGFSFKDLFGRCPFCDKPLKPVCRFKGTPKLPEIGKGPLSRAKCKKCKSIIEYVGNGKWIVIVPGDKSRTLPPKE